MFKAAFFCNSSEQFYSVYSEKCISSISDTCNVYPKMIDQDNLESELPELAETEIVFSTWGMPSLNREQIANMPKLKAVFYAAGSVQGFARPFLEAGVKVLSSWAANAVPVAEFTVAQIMLANKGYFRNILDCSTFEGRQKAFRGIGNFDTPVSLLGAGMIGRKVIELLKPYKLDIKVFDPFMNREKAKELGVHKVELAEAFSEGMAVSNHLANLPETQKMLKEEHFASMRENAVFINTGRGATVDENGMINVLEKRPDLTALLDVTYPEPPLENSPLYKLPNVLLSSHIAGSLNSEVVRMAEYMVDEFNRWSNNGELHYNVTMEMLKTMA